MKRICVYCGSSPGRQPEYAEAATDLGKTLLDRGLGLVYGGAQIGIMGKIADTVIQGGAKSSASCPGPWQSGKSFTPA